ncbi:MAG: hypothetical protein HZB19_03610 [Chloroflexi bacterium]|nr:hypothetical protein [Chloroflexota bacterium]
MNDGYSLLAIVIGLILRLVLPIGLTLLVIALLRKLDEHWQAEAEREQHEPIVQFEGSWDLKNCPIEQRNASPMLVSNFPCWQVHRLPNGYLSNECLTCKVFRNAPLPAHSHA